QHAFFQCLLIINCCAVGGCGKQPIAAGQPFVDLCCISMLRILYMRKAQAVNGMLILGGGCQATRYEHIIGIQKPEAVSIYMPECTKCLVWYRGSVKHIL